MSRGDGARHVAADGPFGAFARLPLEADAQALLLERLRVLDAAVQDEEAGGNEVSVVAFRLGENERYAVPYRYAEEVLPPLRPTPVPCTPPSVAGVVNRRGELLTVLDLKQFFRTRQEGYPADAHILVLRAAGITVGVLVDELIGEQAIDLDRLGPGIPSEAVTNVDYVQGIHNGSMTILDVPALLGDPGLIVNERVT